MIWTIDNSTLPNFIRVENEGDVTFEGFSSMWDAILQSAFWRPGTPVLFDNRKINKVPSDGSGSRLTDASMRYFSSRAEEIGQSRIAILSAGDSNYRYTRQFQYGIRTRDVPVNLQVFFAEKDALAWLSLEI